MCLLVWQTVDGGQDWNEKKICVTSSGFQKKQKKIFSFLFKKKRHVFWLDNVFKGIANY